MQRPKAALDEPSTTRSVLTVALAGLAASYPLSLMAIAILVRELGEHWWLTMLLLYAPPQLYALPLPIISLLLVGARRWRWLWTQALAVAILLLGLMGLALPGFSASGDSTSIKVLSFNVDSARAGVDKIADTVAAIDADLVLIQEPISRRHRLAERLRRDYRYVETTQEFITASRFPLRLSDSASGSRASSVEYLVRTPLGEIRVFNIHPNSPRGSMNMYRFREVLQALKSGQLFSTEARSDVQANAALRKHQLAQVAARAQRSQQPVLIAGDSNCPHLSPVLRESFPNYTDGFMEAGSGFGFTYPERFPWLRLDRIFASPKLEFSHFRVACHDLSDHLCVVAELTLRD